MTSHGERAQNGRWDMTGLRRGDLISLGAILSGTALSLWVLPATYEALGPPVPSAQVVPVALESPITFHGQGVAFHASNLGGGWSLEGDYGGYLTREGSTLRVELSTAMVRAAWVGVEEPHLMGVRLALVEDTSEGWRIVETGPLQPLDRTIHQGEDLQLAGRTLTLPDVSESELVGRWMVVVHELRASGADGWTTARTYAHADWELLPRLMGWVEDGC
jgi:hypothetical protein